MLMSRRLLDSNINIQMNYWFAEITGVPSHVVTPLFDYIEVRYMLYLCNDSS